jgi:hypothetical protein
MADVRSPIAQIATIDCTLITIETEDGDHFGFDTANQISVEPQIETEDAVTLIVKGILRAQKPQKDTLTGHEITLSDNLFNPELIAILQGGTVLHDPEDPSIVIGYEPPVAGSRDKGEVFTLHAYTAQYDTAGLVVQYERLSYPNCQGRPVSFSSEDGAFRAPEYTIFSAPRMGEPPYSLSYIPELPVIIGQAPLPKLTVTSVAGTNTGDTTITVAPTLASGNTYMFTTSPTPITLPMQWQTVTEYTTWNGSEDIAAVTGHYIAIVEVDADHRAVAGGQTTVVSAT